MERLARFSPTKQRLLSSLHRVAQLKSDSLPQPALLPTPDMRQWISAEYKEIFFEQLSIVVEKDQRDLQNRSIKEFPTLRCDCQHAQPPLSPQMGSFRTWQQLRVFFEGSYGLKTASSLKVIRVFQCPEEEELEELSGVTEKPLLGVDSHGIPSGCQDVKFIDKHVILYVLAEQTKHAPSCLFRIQVKAIVETHVMGPAKSDFYFTV
jgi:hypothetical protein